MGVLKLNLKEPYKIRIEKKEEFENSIFSDVYKEAENLLREYIDNSAEGRKKYNKKKNLAGVEYLNNIISFVGERGSGKTSTMISFGQSLEEDKYEVLEILEPSNFEDNTDILELVVAKIFKSFKNKILENENEDINIETDIQKLLEKFEKLYECLRVLNQDKNKFYEREDIDNLIAKSNVVGLKEILKETLNDYLNTINKIKEKEKQVFVLMIDDLDLNDSNLHKILEKIRRYLIIPNLVILMAFNKKQLLEKIFDSNKKELGKKYFEKLFPMERIIEMPENIWDKELHSDMIDDKETREEIFETSKTKKVSEVFEKLFSDKMSEDIRERLELLKPKTIRETINQLKFLMGLPREKSYQNILAYSNKIINDIDLINKLENYKNLDKKILNEKNWINEIEKIDEKIENYDENTEDINVTEEKRKLYLEKIFLIGYLNENLKSLENCIPSNFDIIEESIIDFNGIPRGNKSYLSEKMINFILYDNILEKNEELREIYADVFYENRINILNILKLLKIDEKEIIFGKYYELLRKLKEDKLYVTVESISLNDLINKIKIEVEDIFKVKIEEFSILELDINLEKELGTYMSILFRIDNNILDKLFYIDRDSLINFLKNYMNIVKIYNEIEWDSLFLGIEKNEKNIEKYKDSIENFINLFIFNQKEIKASLRKVVRIEKELEVIIKKRDKLEKRNKLRDKFISEYQKKIKEIKENIKNTNEQYKVEEGASVKTTLLNLKGKYENEIKALEKGIENLKTEKILDSIDDIEVDDFDKKEEIVKMIENIIEDIFKKLNVNLEKVIIFSDDIFKFWIDILDSEKEEQNG